MPGWREFLIPDDDDDPEFIFNPRFFPYYHLGYDLGDLELEKLFGMGQRSRDASPDRKDKDQDKDKKDRKGDRRSRRRREGDDNSDGDDDNDDDSSDSKTAFQEPVRYFDLL